MDSFDLSNLQMPQSGSQLLAEPTPDISSSSSRTGHGGDDLSLSELSLSERAQSKPGHRRPFSLLARPESPDESAVADGDAEDGEEPDMDGTMTQEDLEKARKLAAKTREEKLQHDLFTLKKLNAAFEVYKEALRETKSNTDVSPQCSLTRVRWTHLCHSWSPYNYNTRTRSWTNTSAYWINPRRSLN